MWEINCGGQTCLLAAGRAGISCGGTGSSPGLCCQDPRSFKTGQHVSSVQQLSAETCQISKAEKREGKKYKRRCILKNITKTGYCRLDRHCSGVRQGPMCRVLLSLTHCTPPQPQCCCLETGAGPLIKQGRAGHGRAQPSHPPPAHSFLHLIFFPLLPALQRILCSAFDNVSPGGGPVLSVFQHHKVHTSHTHAHLCTSRTSTG